MCLGLSGDRQRVLDSRRGVHCQARAGGAGARLEPGVTHQRRSSRRSGAFRYYRQARLFHRGGSGRFLHQPGRRLPPASPRYLDRVPRRGRWLLRRRRSRHSIWPRPWLRSLTCTARSSPRPSGRSPSRRPHPTSDAITARHRKAALEGIGLFNRAGRAAAKTTADQAAQAEVAAITENDRGLHAEDQAQLDALWQRLLDNDPDVVLGMLAEAFEDNEAAAASVGVHACEASLVVLVPNPAAVPERRPATTPAGTCR